VIVMKERARSRWTCLLQPEKRKKRLENLYVTVMKERGGGVGRHAVTTVGRRNAG
jgi:hypothetical protein